MPDQVQSAAQQAHQVWRIPWAQALTGPIPMFKLMELRRLRRGFREHHKGKNPADNHY